MDLPDLFDKASSWTTSKIAGAKDKLDAQTPCEGWNVRTLVNHLLATHEWFTGAAQGKQVSPPLGDPEDVLGDDPAKQYEEARQTTLAAFRAEGVSDKIGPMLGIAFADQLLHGWDVAKATGQDATMPADLAVTAFSMIDGQLTDENRGTAFGKPVTVPEDASAQDKLLAYSGRQP